MEKTVKTESVVKVFNLIQNAKYSKMKDADKVSIWKIYRAIKSIGKTFLDDVSDVQQKFVPYETFFDDLQKAKAYESAKLKNEEYADMTSEEYQKFIAELSKYNK